MKLATSLTTLAFATSVSQGAYTFSGSSITENFNGLPTTTIASVFSNTVGTQAAISGTGFVGTKLSGSGTAATGLTVDAGGGTSGAIYSYGTGTATDRALGTLASGTNVMGFGFELINSTPTLTITDITISFTQENWRNSTSAVNTTAASYTTGAAASTTFLTEATGFTAASALSLVGPAAVTTQTALDGNAVGNQAARTLTVSGLSILPGQSFYLRWLDANDAGNDAGLAMDNLSLSFVTVPEPNVAALLGGLGVLGLLRRRR